LRLKPLAKLCIKRIAEQIQDNEVTTTISDDNDDTETQRSDNDENNNNNRIRDESTGLQIQHRARDLYAWGVAAEPTQQQSQ
jgi:hypothetical protein